MILVVTDTFGGIANGAYIRRIKIKKDEPIKITKLTGIKGWRKSGIDEWKAKNLLAYIMEEE